MLSLLQLIYKVIWRHPSFVHFVHLLSDIFDTRTHAAAGLIV